MKNKKVLVIDDEKTVCDSVKKILTRKGYAVEDSLNAKEAMEKIKKTSFDLVITDMKMPEVSGLELLELIKEYYPELDVILITGYPSFDSAKKAFRLGAIEYLSKPFTPNELIDITEKAINRKKIYIEINKDNKENNIEEYESDSILATFYENDTDNRDTKKVSNEKIYDMLESISDNPSILDEKVRELIYIALSISTQRPWSLSYHVKKAFNKGASRQEILYAASMAFSMVGGPSPSYVIPLQEALAKFDAEEGKS